MAQLKPTKVNAPKSVSDKPIGSGKMVKVNPPNLDKFLGERQKNYISYMEGAKIYSMNYYAFVKLAKEAGANKRIKKKVVVDLDLVEAYIEENCKGDTNGL